MRSIGPKNQRPNPTPATNRIRLYEFVRPEPRQEEAQTHSFSCNDQPGNDAQQVGRGNTAPRGCAAHLGKGGASPSRSIPSEQGRFSAPDDAAVLPPGAKKSRSGSARRRRQHLEQFRTDDAEHEALHAKVRASGCKSLGEFVMQLAAIVSAPETRARRRARVSFDSAALMRGLVAFNREHNNFNQAVRALNTLVLVADERSNSQLASEIRRLQHEIALLQQQFSAPVAAILGAMQRDM